MKDSAFESKVLNNELNIIKDDQNKYYRNIYSDNSKDIGDRVEEIVKKYLEQVE